MRIRFLTIMLCSFMLLSFPVGASVCGEMVDSYSVTLSDDAVLFENRYWSGADLRTEYYVDANIGDGISASIVCSEELWKKDSFTTAIERKTDDRAVLAGINGGYYTVATGEPVGILVSDGVLLADDEGLFAIGFQKSGQMCFGQPQVKTEIRISETEIPISSINRTTSNGIQAFTGSYSSRIEVDTGSIAILFSMDGTLRIAGDLPLAFERVIPENTIIQISGKQLLILMPFGCDEATEERIEAITNLSTESDVLFSSSCNEEWEEVESAVGILYPLIMNGDIRPGLEITAAPRTAIGFRENGSLILYVLDGRQNGYSIGGDLNMVAQRMKELGCVFAGALDGGGSTQLHANIELGRSMKLVNKPSEGRARSVSNYLTLRNNNAATGKAVRIIAEPYSIHAVAGAQIPLSILGSDRYGYAAALPSQVSFNVSDGLGEVLDGVYYAEGNGSGAIIVSALGCERLEIPLYISTSPESIELYGEKYGKKTETLTLDPGQEVDLRAQAKSNHIVLYSDDECFSWSLNESVGVCDKSGHIIAGNSSCSGALQVSLGESTVTIPITIWTGIPFSDVAVDDSYFEAVKFVYDQGIFKGTGDTIFDPDMVMTRGMLVTVLWRMSGEPEAHTSVSFEDVPKGSWYENSIAWAAENGLVKGYSEREFAPNDYLTMEQIMTILYRWAGEPVNEMEFTSNVTDYAQDYALDALVWAENYGMLQNDIQSVLPYAPMTRAMVAEVILFWSDYSESVVLSS